MAKHNAKNSLLHSNIPCFSNMEIFAIKSIVFTSYCLARVLMELQIKT